MSSSAVVYHDYGHRKKECSWMRLVSPCSPTILQRCVSVSLLQRCVTRFLYSINHIPRIHVHIFTQLVELEVVCQR